VVDPKPADGRQSGPGDLWYYPKGHGHAIQTSAGAGHAILAFDDGLYSEHGTFGISDWMTVMIPACSRSIRSLGGSFAQIPKAETYSCRVKCWPGGPQARSARELDHARRIAMP